MGRRETLSLAPVPCGLSEGIVGSALTKENCRELPLTDSDQIFRTLQYDAMIQKHPREVLNERDLWAHSKRGQNFLVPSDLLGKVADSAELGNDDVAFEVGAGLGRLSRRLAARAGRLVTVEIDRGLHEVAAENLGDLDNVRLLCADVLQDKHTLNGDVDAAVREVLAESGGTLKVAANLPYWISSPLLLALLEWDVPLEDIYVMLQEEVAERLTASEGEGQYGPLTVVVNHWGRVEKLFDVPPTAFWPQPEVGSTFVHIKPRPFSPRPDSYALFHEVVNTLFQNRRKMVRKGLKLRWSKRVSARVVEESGVDGRKRPEKLTTEQFVALSNAVGSALGQEPADGS